MRRDERVYNKHTQAKRAATPEQEGQAEEDLEELSLEYVHSERAHTRIGVGHAQRADHQKSVNAEYGASSPDTTAGLQAFLGYAWQGSLPRIFLQRIEQLA